MSSKALTILFLTGKYIDKKLSHREATSGTDPDLLGRKLKSQGISVRERRVNGFPVNPLAAFGTFYAGFDPIRALQVLLLDRNVDVIISVGESNIFLILLFARLFRFRPRVVLREISARGWRRRDMIVDFVVPRVDRVMVLTAHQKALAESRFRLKAPPDLVGFAIDETLFRPCQSGNNQVIVAVGDDAGRDYLCLVKACNDFPHRVILRTDTRPTIPANLQGRIETVGRLSTAELRDLYAAASIVVVPLKQVDHPSGITTLFEAMSMGCTIVASDTGSTREFIDDGKNGILVTVGDSAAMGAAITRLMADPALRATLGKNARMTIEERYSYDAYVRRLVDSLHCLFPE